MNGLDAYNIINKVKQVFPKKYHRPHELVFNKQTMTDRYCEEWGEEYRWYYVSPKSFIVGCARPKRNDVIINIPILKDFVKNPINGGNQYRFPIGNVKELLAYVYLHECGHLASNKPQNLDENIVDKFATYWFNKLKDKL